MVSIRARYIASKYGTTELFLLGESRRSALASVATSGKSFGVLLCDRKHRLAAENGSWVLQNLQNPTVNLPKHCAVTQGFAVSTDRCESR
jgi:hypothetical protein